MSLTKKDARTVVKALDSALGEIRMAVALNGAVKGASLVPDPRLDTIHNQLMSVEKGIESVTEALREVAL